MKNTVLLIFCLISLSISAGTYPSEKDVLLIDEQNFGQVIHEHKYLLVLFYSKDDPNCVEIIPEFEKVASMVKKENFITGKIDSDKSPKIINHLKIETFPSIALIKKTVPINYEGEKKPEAIIKWLKEQTKKEFKKFSTKAELEEFKKQHELSFIYFGKNEQILNEIYLAERKMDDMPMGQIESEELKKEFAKPEEGNKEFIILFTRYDEGKKYLYDIKSEKIIDFFNLYFTPKVIDFTAQTSVVLFAKKFPSLVIFSLKRQKNYEEIKNVLDKLWPKLNKKLKLFRSDIEEGMSVKLAEYCGIRENEIPKAYIIEPITENPIKYRMEEAITEENLLKFVEKWEKKQLIPYLRTEDEPEENDGDIFVVVGKTFKKEVINNDKDVLIYFFAPWCEHCKEFYPGLEKLARKMKKKNPNLLFAKMDATENDIEDYPINKYPTIKFYPGNAKNKEPIHFNNRQSIDDLLNLIKEKAYHKINDEDYNTQKLGHNTDL